MGQSPSAAAGGELLTAVLAWEQGTGLQVVIQSMQLSRPMRAYRPQEGKSLDPARLFSVSKQPPTTYPVAHLHALN